MGKDGQVPDWFFKQIAKKNNIHVNTCNKINWTYSFELEIVANRTHISTYSK